MSFNKWRNKKSSQVSSSGDTLVSTSFLDESPTLPIVYQCRVPGVNLASWYVNNESEILDNLAKYGAVLFRGFKLIQQQDFNEFVSKAIPQTAEYIEGATPRTHLAKGVYTATEFPADQEIALHNELSYVTNPPSTLAFCCLKAPEQGGQTQIADITKVLAGIDQAIVDEFSDRQGWLLRRNYGNGFGPTVAKAFGNEDIGQIKAYCDKAKIKLTEAGDGMVTTEQIRSAVHQHPKSKQSVWFNHIAFWHPSALCPKVRAKMEEVFSLAEFPYSTYYGDGSEIPKQTIDALRQAYRQAEVKFDWREGDVMLLDNWKVAHGRKPFKGERRVLVAMG